MGQCSSRGDRFSDSETNRPSDRRRQGSARRSNLIGMGMSFDRWEDGSSSHHENKEDGELQQINDIIRRQDEEIANKIDEHRNQHRELKRSGQELDSEILSSQKQDLLELHLRYLEELQPFASHAQAKACIQDTQNAMRPYRKKLQENFVENENREIRHRKCPKSRKYG